LRIPPENNYYDEVILNDPTLTVNNPVEGHEIQIIIGSLSKVAKGTLIEFAKKLTEHTRVNQGWSGVHAIVESRDFRELSPLENRRIPKATSTLGLSKSETLPRTLSGMMVSQGSYNVEYCRWGLF
jgi:hypothetical protein